ncbi:YlbF family regulator [Thermoanaerobacterium thermosaccharolyticum]|jgi:cell fate (sporulation/competence/biofilm development) regulator YlbF (YheA/YmcA/DUF963 family)|uniref:YlbF family regulator n=1 Tax=Thermoanaerobacterium thermosaccharolyticum TaxID=1517 RepID=UPI00177EEF79|nr:YlbF family regulator [Thermoanaerobacterium thermosaccharolyticum]MBE0067752.1 YlbF family regulator [Thermoanaerobacterium thermosaccharolyticum]MBE0227318.1 YlbF family regulator [Thermoanaerobacterium thermosaccharolyticum]
MNVYDKAYELKRAIEELPEYKAFKDAFKRVNANEQNKKMLEDFRKKQLEIQTKELTGKEVTKEDEEMLKKLYEILSLNPELNAYLSAEYSFSRIMDDITKIIMDVVNLK